MNLIPYKGCGQFVRSLTIWNTENNFIWYSLISFSQAIRCLHAERLREIKGINGNSVIIFLIVDILNSCNSLLFMVFDTISIFVVIVTTFYRKTGTIQDLL